MNSASVKYKSFFYSLAIHLAIGIIALGVYFKPDKEHEVYSLVNLKSMHICTPAISQPVKKVQAKPKQIKQVKREVVKPLKKIVKPTPKPVIAKKTVPLKSEPLKEVVFVKPEPVQPEKELQEPVEVQEEVIQKTQVAMEEETAPVVAVSEPELSYEAQYMQDNIALINALIKKNLSYPRLARKRGLQGKAMVSFTLNEEGEVSDIEALGILSSILKKSAIKTVKKASNSFPHPSQVLALRIPIVYKLH